MKRQTKPYFKKSHKAFYVNLNGKPIRLASEAEGREKAMEAYFRVMAGLATERRPDRGGAHAPLHSLA